MAVRRLEVRSLAAAGIVAGPREVVEPTSTTDCGRESNYSETVDSDVDENTKDMMTSSGRFPIYVDCQESLVELSFIKWIAGFRHECRRLSKLMWKPTHKEVFYGLVNFYHVNIASEMVDCRNKTNKSTLLKNYVEQTLSYFNDFHRRIKETPSNALDAIYYDKMSSLLAYHIDLKLMASQRYKDKSWHRKTSSKINASLSIYLGDNIDYMFDTIFQLYYIFYGSNNISLGPILLPVLKKLLAERPIPSKLKFLTYLRYILCFKLWKKLILSSSLGGCNKRKEIEQIRLLLRRLNPPRDFMTQHEKYNWSNWPKLTMSSNGTIDSIERDLKNVTFVLYGANLLIKECYKDILDASRKDISLLLKSVEEKCQILRPDIFVTNCKELLDEWNSNYDRTLKPLIPTTRSCNSLLRKIKYNLISENVKSEFTKEKNMKENNPSISNVQIIQKNNDTLVVNKSGENADSNTLHFKENFSNHDQKTIEKTNHSNTFKNKVVEENKVRENVLKTVFINGESISTNVKQQSSEDGLQINSKKIKLSEKHAKQKNEDVNRLDTPSSNSINKIDSCVESTVPNTGCSLTLNKGSKRIQSSPINENEISKKVCKTKSRHEKNVFNSNQNQNIDFDCQNLDRENICCATSSTDNLLLEHLKNSQDTIEIAHLEPPAKENKWVTKSSSSEASALNLKYSQNNFSNCDQDENLKTCRSQVNELNNRQDGVTSPSSDIQWPIKLSPCDPDSPESKPLINNPEQMEIEAASSDTEGNNSPKTENLLSLRNTDEIMSKLVFSRRSINENENNQIYALPVDQKPTHSYVENAISSSTRDLEVVNVLSPVSTNSTDIPLNKSSWVPDLSLAHVHSDHNDDGDHSQSSIQQLNGLCNSINMNTSRFTNHNSEVENLNHLQLEAPIMSRSYSYNQIEPRVYPDDSYTTSLSPSENSISNPTYGSGNSVYDINRIPLSGPPKSIPITVSPKDAIHEFNSSNKMYHGKTINLSFDGLTNKSSKEPQTYSFGMSKNRPTDMSISTIERISPSCKNKNDVHDVISDEFSDVEYMDLRTNSVEPKENNPCLNNLTMSSLIATDLKSANTLCNFENSGNWSTIKNSSDTSNLHKNQKLQVYSDPTELISGSVNLNAQSGISINLNEAHLQKVFLGNKSPSQVYYNTLTDFYVSSDVEMTNHGNVEDPKQNHFSSRPNTRDSVNSCSNDQYIHSVLPPTDNDPIAKPTLISGYDSVLNQNSQIMNNGLLYKFPRSDINASIRYENSIQIPSTNPDCLSPHNGLTFNRFDQLLGANLLDDLNQKEEQNVINMAHLMLHPSKNCKVHYKWPLNKNISQTTVSSSQVQETPQNLDFKMSSNVLYKYPDEELSQSLVQNRDLKDIPNQNSGLSFIERRNDSTSYQSNQQFQDISNLIASDLSPSIQSGSDSIDEKKQSQSQAINDLESNPQKEPSNNQEVIYIHRNAKIPHDKMIAKSNETRKLEIFNEATKHLFNNGKLFVCMYPKCTNSHHFRVIPSNAEMLRHEFTAPYDDLRFNIQYKYKRLLTSSPRTWPNIPDLIQLDQRCLCEICDDFDCKLNQNQDMLHTYVEGKKSVDDDNNENEQPKQSTKPQIRLSWKKHLANRFTSEVVVKQSIPQILEEIKSDTITSNCKIDTTTDSVQSSITEPEDQETDVVHNSRRKKKKKHDKKKDKKKKGKR